MRRLNEGREKSRSLGRSGWWFVAMWSCGFLSATLMSFSSRGRGPSLRMASCKTEKLLKRIKKQPVDTQELSQISTAPVLTELLQKQKVKVISVCADDLLWFKVITGLMKDELADCAKHKYGSIIISTGTSSCSSIWHSLLERHQVVTFFSVIARWLNPFCHECWSKFSFFSHFQLTFNSVKRPKKLLNQKSEIRIDSSSQSWANLTLN